MGLGFALLAPDPASAECTAIPPVTTRKYEAIALAGEASIPRRVVEDAVEYWSSCAAYGDGFPAFLIDHRDRTSRIPVLKIKHAVSSNSRRCAVLEGNQITLYSFARKTAGRPISCGKLAQNLAHELGHFLGLADGSKKHRCKLSIMSTINRHNSRRRRVTTEECRAVDSRWLTARERGQSDQAGDPVEPSATHR